MLAARRGAPDEHAGHARRLGSSARQARCEREETRKSSFNFCFPLTSVAHHHHHHHQNLHSTASSLRPTPGSPASASTPRAQQRGSATPWRRCWSSEGTTRTTGRGAGSGSEGGATTPSTLLRLLPLPPRSPPRAAQRRGPSPSALPTRCLAPGTGLFFTFLPTGSRAEAAAEGRRRRREAATTQPQQQ